MKLLLYQWQQLLHFVCLGLDPEPAKMPDHLRPLAETDPYTMLYTWAKEIVDETHDIVGAYKPNKGFWEAFGPDGLRAYEDIIRYIRSTYPNVPVIADVKIGEIGKSTAAYIKMPLKRAMANAVTLNPYFGEQGIEPALNNLEDGMIVLCRTSNPGGSELQELMTQDPATGQWMRLYQYVAMRVANHWNKNRGNLGVVAGATNPEQLRMIRLIIGDMFMLIPGVGDQAGELELSVMYALDSQGFGFVINSSGGLTFGSKGIDYAKVTKQRTLELNAQIVAARQKELDRRQAFLQVLKDVNALIEGRFVYASGKQGSEYVDKDALFANIAEADKFVDAIVDQYINDEIEVVIGPIVDGALLARDIARRLMERTGRKITPLFVDKIEKPGEKTTFLLKRGYDRLIKDKNVLVVDDVGNSGLSAGESITAVRAAGGIVKGLALLCDRNNLGPQDVCWPPKMFSVVRMKLNAWEENEIPSWLAKRPIRTDYGKGLKYLAAKGQQATA